MAHRSSRHCVRPIAALALEAGTTIGPRCANVHLGPEDQRLHKQAGYTTALVPLGTRLATSLDIREESIYGLLAQRFLRQCQGTPIAELTKRTRFRVVTAREASRIPYL